MQLHKHLLKSVFGKTALAAALGGFLFLAGAPSAQARVWDERPPRARAIVRYDGYRIHRPFARQVFYGRADYRLRQRHEVFVHGWRDRFGCWHRY